MQKSKSVEKSGYEIGCHERRIIIRSQKCLLFLAVQEHIVAIAPEAFFTVGRQSAQGIDIVFSMVGNDKRASRFNDPGKFGGPSGDAGKVT